MTDIVLALPWPDSRLSPNGPNVRRWITKVRQCARSAGYYARALEAGLSVPDHTPLHLFLTSIPRTVAAGMTTT